MKKLILKTLWALSLVVFSGTYAFGQDFTVRQNDHNDRKIQFDFVDATDGFTAETGITPTCTFLRPLASSFVSCVNSVAEIGTGKYRLTLSEAETQNLGMGAIYITHASIRPVRINLAVVSDNRSFNEGATWIKSPSNYNNTSWWTKTGVTVTEDNANDYLGNAIADTITGDGANSQHRVDFTLPKQGGSGFYYIVVEVKSGSLNNAWIGDRNWSSGVDINTSTGVIQPTPGAYLRGWHVDELASGWFRVHLLYAMYTDDGSNLIPVLALGNGTVGTSPPTFVTSGSMVFARAHIIRAEDVAQELLNQVLPNLQSASSTTSVTLALSESTTNNLFNNREICFSLGYSANAYNKSEKACSCITAYNGTTKVATISPALHTTLSSSYKYKIGGVCLNNIASVSGAVGSVTGAVGSVTANVNAQVVGMNTSVITEDAIAPAAITSSEFAQSAADKVWNTAPQDGSASTALGYLDAIKKYVANKMSIVGSNYTIYKDDQTTSYATGTTNSAGRDPD